MIVDALHPFDLRDRALTLGDGLFDTCLAIDGAPVLPERHLRRLWNSCQTMGYGIEKDALARVYAPVPNQPAVSVLRITVTGGPGPRGLGPPAERKPNILTNRSPWSTGHFFRRLHLSLSTMRRNETAPTARHKTVSYLDNIMAMMQARERGADDALLLNTRGAAVCTTLANLFLVDANGRLATPPLRDGVVDGVTRELVLDIAKVLGLAADERSIGREDLEAAQGVFVTNSLGLLMPVTGIESRAYRSAANPLFRKLSAALIEALGLGAHADWSLQGGLWHDRDLRDCPRGKPR